MLDNQEVVNFLNTNLNSIEFPQAYLFNIFSEVGKSKDDGKIEGILRVIQNEPLSVPNVVNVTYKADIELVAPASVSNKAIIKIEKLLGKFVKTFNGKEQVFGDGKGLLNFTLAKTGDFKTEYSYGNILPLAFSISINYTENMVTTGSKVWLLNDMVIPYLKEQVLLEKEGKTSPIYGDYFKKTLLTGQQKLYNFIFPYDNTNTLCSTLQKDILTGDFNKTYTLKYYDGVSYTQAEPFVTTVSLVRNSDTGGDRPKTGMFNITFSDVDDGTSQTKYELALIDNPFDDQSENTRWFANQAEQQTYFLGLVTNGGADFVEIKAPNINSLILTNQIYQNTHNYDLFDLLNKNYAIIKVTKFAQTELETDTILYFYYKVSNPSVGANNQVIYQLEMDTLQTYYFNQNLNFEGSFIQKGHLDRWIYSYEALTTRPTFADAKTYGYYYKVGDNYLLITSEMTAEQYDEIATIYEKVATFNGKADSKLFEREEIKEVAKRLVQRSKLKIYSVLNPDMANWLEENVLCWVYVLAKTSESNQTIVNILTDSNGNYAFDSTYSYFSLVSFLKYGYKVLCYPLYKPTASNTLHSIYISTNYKASSGSSQTSFSPTKYIKLGTDGFEGYLNSNGTAYIMSLKLSVKPPFSLDSTYYQYQINNNGDLYITGLTNGNNGSVDIINRLTIGDYTPNGLERVIATQKQTGLADNYYGLVDILVDDPNPKLFKLDISLPKRTFKKSEIKNVTKNKQLNPKLNSIDYKNLTLTFAGSSYEFDIQKLNKSTLNFKYNEMITLDATKGLLRLNNLSNTDIFNTAYMNSFNGFAFTNDLSLPFASSQYDEFIANNKNAYLSFQNQQNYISRQQELRESQMATNMAIQAVSQAATFQPISAATTIAQGTANIMYDALSTANTLAYNETQFNLSIDNMKSRPNVMSNVDGNALFISAIAEFGLYAEIYEGLDNELEIANDIMNKDGFTVNHFGNPRNYDHIRSKFNYVRAVLGNLSGIPISAEARANLRQRFANGVRFWNSDTIDYSQENYELALDT